MNQSNEQWRKDAHQKDLQRLRGFRPIDDTFMRGLFRENLPLAELVLRIITGKPDLVLTHCETQADMNRRRTSPCKISFKCDRRREP